MAGRDGKSVVGATSVVAAFLGFGMLPFAAAPVAHGDDFGIGEALAGLLGEADGFAAPGRTTTSFST